MAPVSDTDEQIPYDEAREIVLDCYSSFSPELGEAAGELLRATATSTPRRGPASAAARSAPTPCRRATRT